MTGERFKSFAVFFTAPFNNMWTYKFKVQLTKVFFHYCQSNDRRLPASDDCQECGDQNKIVMHSSDNIVKSWEPLNIWLMVAKNAFVGWAVNFKSLHVIERCSEQDVTENYICPI